RALRPKLYPVIMTAHISVETAARSLKEGAIDYVSKPLTIDQIRAISARADSFRSQSLESKTVAAPEPQESAIVGRSPKMLEVYKAIGRVAASNVHVLITGGSGPGKEWVARVMDDHCQRDGQPFPPSIFGSVAG